MCWHSPSRPLLPPCCRLSSFYRHPVCLPQSSSDLFQLSNLLSVVIDQDGMLKNVDFSLSKGKTLDYFEGLLGKVVQLGSLN